ncbi:hypothetical protein COT82_02670 [Candidatus Campbellbacteria bacterium CG10_big_fil_rev_8_21_14_0_10_35_52]|uniref:Uncharacterized protein n=1 Tax=Candidatus Campbellbacteria bacterium CG10_big_fil_rev_8_21_14_0_10_35_52 TaxID=1974527 RepID=A0A2M6WUS3_9BACT|nr:MAG: hypothetical protein COT82_02670 [Candidatus Campbellbacteria bacterium CG10_big_fil_rev_8_21_14_0_10_35_52]
MSWASKRRTAYFGTAIFIVITVAGILFFLIFNKEPTCEDDKKNGDEQGIDCGGLCDKLCATQVSAPIIIWSRSFKVSEGVYNSVAYVENPNFTASAPKIPYTFKIFDDNNILIAERNGNTFISPDGISLIFEGAIITGNRIPARTFFEFSEAPIWTRTNGDKSSLSINNIKLSVADISPRVDAVLSNNSLLAARNIEVVAVVFDANDNAIGASATFVESISDRSSQDIVFTWPNKFDQSVSRVEIIPRVNME